MKLAIMQPYFFAYLGYWQLLAAVDKYVVYDDVNFIKGGWINRNYIISVKREREREREMITVPLKNASSFQKIKDTQIADNKHAINKVIKTLELTYKKAPYYDVVMPMIRALLTSHTNICELNYKAMQMIRDYLGIDTEIILSSDIKKDDNLRGQDKVIHINKILGAKTYINAIGGQTLYDKYEFAKNNIKLNFIKMKDIKYKQFNNEFVPNLSIIDVLMFNDKTEIGEFLKNYELI